MPSNGGLCISTMKHHSLGKGRGNSFMYANRKNVPNIVSAKANERIKDSISVNKQAQSQKERIQMQKKLFIIVISGE